MTPAPLTAGELLALLAVLLPDECKPCTTPNPKENRDDRP